MQKWLSALEKMMRSRTPLIDDSAELGVMD
jgi:hypothetical protein